MITYPEMNAKIKDLLRGDGSNYAVYAAQQIEDWRKKTASCRP